METGNVKWFDNSKGFGLFPAKAEMMSLYIILQFKVMATSLWTKVSQFSLK